MWYLTRLFSKFAPGELLILPWPFDIQLLSSLLKYKPFGRINLLVNLIFSFTISGIVTSINVYIGGFSAGFWQILLEYAINTLWVFIGFSIMAYPIIELVKVLNNRVPWSSSWLNRVLVNIVLIILISIITALFFALFPNQLVDSNEQILSLVLKYFTFSFIACMTFVLLIEAVVFFNDREAMLKKNEKLIQENLTTKFEVLKNQINPHFLFNNLNVLSSLVYKDPKQADRFILEFSNIYRYILDMQNESTVTVEKEMKFLDSYIYLLEQRFRDSLKIERKITDESLAKRLPPLTMQLLMENAIKHNVFSADQPLEISIDDQSDKIIFGNKIIPREQNPESSGIGLSNIKERYSLISTKSPSITSSDGYFIVELPLLS